MNTLLFDHPETRMSLLPLTYTKPVAALRLGILTIAEKWEHELKTKVTFLTQDYLQGKFPSQISDDNLYINGALCPDEQLKLSIESLSFGQGLKKDGSILAFRYGPIEAIDRLNKGDINFHQYEPQVCLIRYGWDLFLRNGEQITADYHRVTHGRKSNPITDPYTFAYNSKNIFIEDGVSIKAAIINAEAGPVYLGKNAEVQEGTIIQGPFALGENAQLRLGGKMRLNTTVGPNCKVGGEVGNVVFQDNTNKAHEGFLGNSVIGSWCNLGADTNNSNLKNNYSNVSCWNYHKKAFIDSGLQFCGTIMGDHSKCSINTMLNTGTVVGVSASIFGAGFPHKFVPSFIWGGIATSQEYQFEKACETMALVMNRKSVKFDQEEKLILNRVFELSSVYRSQVLNQ